MSPSAHAVSDVIRLSQATSGKASVCVGVCGAESCSQSRSKQIGPDEGADRFGYAAQAMRLQMAAMICPLA